MHKSDHGQSRTGYDNNLLFCACNQSRELYVVSGSSSKPSMSQIFPICSPISWLLLFILSSSPMQPLYLYILLCSSASKETDGIPTTTCTSLSDALWYLLITLRRALLCSLSSFSLIPLACSADDQVDTAYNIWD